MAIFNFVDFRLEIMKSRKSLFHLSKENKQVAKSQISFIAVYCEEIFREISLYKKKGNGTVFSLKGMRQGAKGKWVFLI